MYTLKQINNIYDQKIETLASESNNATVWYKERDEKYHIIISFTNEISGKRQDIEVNKIYNDLVNVKMAKKILANRISSHMTIKANYSEIEIRLHP